MNAPDSATVAIVMAKLEYLRAENDALRAKWNAVPWGIIADANNTLIDFAANSNHQHALSNAGDIALWLDANAPKDAAK